MSAVQVAAGLMLGAQGLLSGGALIITVDRLSVWPRMSTTDYATDFRRSILRVDPLMPILAVIASISAAVFALTSDDASRSFAWAGLGLTVILIVASAAYIEPINSKFRSLPEGQAPEEADRYRVAWRRFHTVRTIAFTAAFVCMIVAVVA